jgi:hypothetical protein
MTDHQEDHHSEHGAGFDPQEFAHDLGRMEWGAILKAWIPFFVGIAAAMIVGWIIWQPIVYAKKQQPVDFNHQMHVQDVGMDCADCHYFDSAGRFSGIPADEMCLDCHTWSYPQNEDNPKEMAFLEEYVGQDDQLLKSIDWHVYSKQPDTVYFSHIAHVEMGGFECAECHLGHQDTSTPPPYYENRITKYSRFVYRHMKMDDCGACHTKHDVPQNNACFVCHK